MNSLSVSSFSFILMVQISYPVFPVFPVNPGSDRHLEIPKSVIRVIRVIRDNPRFRQLSGEINTRPFIYIALRWSAAC